MADQSISGLTQEHVEEAITTLVSVMRSCGSPETRASCAIALLAFATGSVPSMDMLKPGKGQKK